MFYGVLRLLKKTTRHPEHYSRELKSCGLSSTAVAKYFEILV